MKRTTVIGISMLLLVGCKVSNIPTGFYQSDEPLSIDQRHDHLVNSDKYSAYLDLPLKLTESGIDSDLRFGQGSFALVLIDDEGPRLNTYLKSSKRNSTKSSQKTEVVKGRRYENARGWFWKPTIPEDYALDIAAPFKALEQVLTEDGRLLFNQDLIEQNGAQWLQLDLAPFIEAYLEQVQDPTVQTVEAWVDQNDLEDTALDNQSWSEIKNEFITKNAQVKANRLNQTMCGCEPLRHIYNDNMIDGGNSADTLRTPKELVDLYKDRFIHNGSGYTNDLCSDTLAQSGSSNFWLQKSFPDDYLPMGCDMRHLDIAEIFVLDFLDNQRCMLYSANYRDRYLKNKKVVLGDRVRDIELQTARVPEDYYPGTYTISKKGNLEEIQFCFANPDGLHVKLNGELVKNEFDESVCTFTHITLPYEPQIGSSTSAEWMDIEDIWPNLDLSLVFRKTNPEYRPINYRLSGWDFDEIEQLPLSSPTDRFERTYKHKSEKNHSKSEFLDPEKLLWEKTW